MRSPTILACLAALVGIYALRPTEQPTSGPAAEDGKGLFVVNQGQWNRAVRFAHRSGPMTLFLRDRGFVVDLAARAAGRGEKKLRGAALEMTFEGGADRPEIVGENQLAGHHNYFLGDDESRWRTGVPLYRSVRYRSLYPGTDLRLREARGIPEYDLLLQPGSDLSALRVRVEGGRGLSIAGDGSLVVQTSVGPLVQSPPRTWEVDRHGAAREVACRFTLLGADRFGFDAPGWDRDTSLTIDPGLVWSTFLGGKGRDSARAVHVDARGVVTVAGNT